MCTLLFRRVWSAAIRSLKKSTLIRWANLASPSRTGDNSGECPTVFKTRKYVTNTNLRISVCCVRENITLNFKVCMVSVRPYPLLCWRKYDNGAFFLRLCLLSTLITNGAFQIHVYSSNRKNLKTPALSFRVDRNHFKNRTFWKQCHFPVSNWQ